MQIVTITMQGGVIQDIDAPDNVIVRVRDYDVDGIEPKMLNRDDDNHKYLLTEWQGGEA